MLIAQRYLQMENVFAVTLEAKVSRLDDSGVYGTDGDFMDFVSAHGEEVGYSREYPLSNAAARSIRGVKPDRLEPWMALRLNLPLFGNFALEPMCLRTFEG